MGEVIAVSLSVSVSVLGWVLGELEAWEMKNEAGSGSNGGLLVAVMCHATSRRTRRSCLRGQGFLMLSSYTLRAQSARSIECSNDTEGRPSPAMPITTCERTHSQPNSMQ